MRMTITLILVCLVGLIIYFHKDIKGLVEEASLPDQNPELVTYLQGDWAVMDDAGSIVRIKKDSMIKIYDDTIRSVNILSYVFNGAASKYFINDSSFAFGMPGKNNIGAYDFKLKEINNKSLDTTWDTVLYVSRSRLDMMKGGRTIKFRRVK